MPSETCVATARRVVDAGLNVIDTAPNYEDGYSEEIVGRAVREQSRDSVFVIDNIDHLDQPVVPQIDDSLARLGLDHTDLFVFHGLSAMNAVDRLCQPGGGFDQLADVVKSGKCRFSGISSHSPDVLRAALVAGVCDVVSVVRTRIGCARMNFWSTSVRATCSNSAGGGCVGLG